MTYINRRNFLQSSTAAGFMGAAGMISTLGGANAFAAGIEGYKALVCITLKGGMDSLDTVLPYDTASHTALRSMRSGIFDQYGVGTGSASRDIENTLLLNTDNHAAFGTRQYALPANMQPLHDLFEAGDMAIIGNVGPLIQPTTRATMDDYSASIPRRLFSHNDQQSTWGSLSVEGAQIGWGGKFIDAALASDPSSNPIFSSISTTSGDVFLSGANAQPYMAPSGTVDPIDILRNKWNLGYGAQHDQVRAILEQHIASRDADFENLFKSDLGARNGRAVDNNKVYINALAGAIGVSTAFPESGLGSQLSSVANTISIRNSLSVRRQIFHVAIGGFDTHDNQATELPDLQAEIAQGLAAFKAALQELGVWNDVTVFTTSDFGRTAIGNGDGTDHGWGGHQFVLGGAVKGKNIYGDIPPVDLSDQHYTGSSGRMIPHVSVEQYAATLGGWFGLNDTEISDALPNLQNFSEKNLGFFNESV